MVDWLDIAELSSNIERILAVRLGMGGGGKGRGGEKKNKKKKFKKI